MVRILLLDPDSEGALLRGKELRQRDVPLAIMSNLYRLARLQAELNEDMRSRLRVRLYDASPSVQMSMPAVSWARRKHDTASSYCSR